MNNRLYGNLDLTGLTGNGEFRVMLCVDTENYSGHSTPEQVELTTHLQEILPEAFRQSHLDWDACLHLDTGDGSATVFPRDLDPREAVIDPLLHNLNGKLREYNRGVAREMRLRLRIAVHMGFAVVAGQSLVGSDVMLLFRLLDNQPLKDTLSLADDANFAVAVSDVAYGHLIKEEPGNIDRSHYHPITLDLHHIGEHQAWFALSAERGAEFWDQIIPPAPPVPPPPPPKPGLFERIGRAVRPGLGRAATGAGAGLRRLFGWLRGRRPPSRRVVIWAGSIFLAVALVAVGLVVILHTVVGCPAPATLNVLTSTSSEQTVRDAAASYRRVQHARGCVRAELIVYAVPDGAAHEALVNGWHTPTELELGPPPNVWMPDTTADRTLLDPKRLAQSGLRLDALGSTRASPYVVGLPAAAAARLDVPRVGASWPAMDQALRAARIPYARPSTVTSTTALAQTSGVWADLKPGKAGSPDERAVEHQLGGGALTGPDEAGLLCALRQGGAPPKAAALVTERALAAYNAGLPLNDQCGRQDRALGEEQRLTPYYPGTVRTADYPMYEVTYGSTDSGEQHQQVRAFFDWLRGEGQAGLAAAGYRDRYDRVHGVLAGGDAGGIEAGLAPARPIAGPDGDGLTGFAAHLTTLRRNVRVLVAVDLSGTMNEPTTRGTRFDASRDAMREAGNLISPGDSIELWGFPAYGKTYGHQSVVPRGDASAYLRGVDKMRPDAPKTPLYQTIQDGVRKLAGSAGKERPGLLVISDGLDDAGGRGEVSAAALRKTLETDGAGVDVLLVDPVRGGCAKASAAGVRCAELDGPGDPVYSFFTGLWGG